MLHASGDDALIGRIENIELRDVGQAFQLGRYPIHFHMIGDVSDSYVRYNSIHHTYNWAVTIHGVRELRVQGNVAYHTMGHTIFIEDAAETGNIIEDNLVVWAKRSWSLLNTDQSPACFWITHPDNIFRRNHAAGADRYGFWFDTQEHAMGPSADENVCPENAKLGEFVDNVAHSMERYGLRVFHNHDPRQYPCEDISADNPSIPANYENFFGYRCLRNGVIASFVGDVHIINATVYDNVLAGIEFEKIFVNDYEKDLYKDFGKATVEGGWVIANSDKALTNTDLIADSKGIIAPRSDYLGIDGTKFYRFTDDTVDNG